MAKRKEKDKLFAVDILHADGTVTHMSRLTVKGLFLLVKVEPGDLLTIFEISM